MICEGCSAAADHEALPGLAKVVNMLSGAAEGHDECAERNRVLEPGQMPDCACQHKVPPPWWMRHFSAAASTPEAKT
jgi:hypothetical protein